jgi:hypothetical protein
VTPVPDAPPEGLESIAELEAIREEREKTGLR